MDSHLGFVFWTWSRWWRWRSRLPGGQGVPPAASHRLHLRPADRVHASGGGNPSLLAVRRMPCALLGSRRKRGRKRRGAPQLTET